MSEFTASNGRTLSIDSRGGAWLNLSAIRIAPDDLLLLREYVIAEQDERLGRWRWPENPDYVFYATPQGCRIIRESTGTHFSWNRSWLTYEGIMQNESSAAARAYFDAHPEPKPWHEAKDGEIWALTVDGLDLVFKVGEVSFIQLHISRDENPIVQPEFTSNRITAGRRVWPEGDGS